MIPNTAEIFSAALLSTFIITLTVIKLKMSLLVASETLGLFVNTLTADNKYSLRNSENLHWPIQMTIIRETNNFNRTFCSISEIYIKF